MPSVYVRPEAGTVSRERTRFKDEHFFIEDLLRDGCIDEVHMPDPSFESGVALQREYLDISNPDSGIFLDRSYKMPGGDNDEYRELCDRMLVVSSGRP